MSWKERGGTWEVYGLCLFELLSCMLKLHTTFTSSHFPLAVDFLSLVSELCLFQKGGWRVDVSSSQMKDETGGSLSCFNA